VWNSFRRLSSHFFVVDDALKKHWAAKEPKVRYQWRLRQRHAAQNSISMLTRITELDLSDLLTADDTPENKFFYSTMPQLRIFKMRGIEKIDEIYLLDANKIETLGIDYLDWYPEWYDPIDLDVLFDDTPWPKLKHLHLEIQRLVHLPGNLIKNVPNLETLVVDLHEDFDDEDEGDGFDPTEIWTFNVTLGHSI
jgi:hypothetical protein